MKTVIYPIANGNYTDSHIPLLMSLRSLEKHLKEEFRVTVLSEKPPHYLSDEVAYLPCKDYYNALEIACTPDTTTYYVRVVADTGTTYTTVIGELCPAVGDGYFTDGDQYQTDLAWSAGAWVVTINSNGPFLIFNASGAQTQCNPVGDYTPDAVTAGYGLISATVSAAPF